MTDPTPTTIAPPSADELEQLQQAVAMLRVDGSPELADELAQLVASAVAGIIGAEAVEARMTEIMAQLLGATAVQPQPITWAEPSADELDAGLELEPAQLDPQPPEQLVAGAQLAEQLAQAGLAGQYLVLTPEQALELADVASFAVYARDNVYPVVVALAPLVQRLGQLGPELAQASPVQLLGLLTGSFGKG